MHGSRKIRVLINQCSLTLTHIDSYKTVYFVLSFQYNANFSDNLNNEVKHSIRIRIIELKKRMRLLYIGSLHALHIVKSYCMHIQMIRQTNTLLQSIEGFRFLLVIHHRVDDFSNCKVRSFCWYFKLQYQY